MINMSKTTGRLVAVLMGLSIMLLPAYALATATAPIANNATTNDTAAVNQQKLGKLISTGNQEINRRLTTLQTLQAVINASTKLTTSEKTDLINRIESAIAGLTQLETKLDNDTILATALSDAQSITSTYRVYYLLFPQTYLLRTADTELVTDSNLTTLAAKLQIRINQAQVNGSNMATMTAQLTDMNTEIAAAMILENSVVSAVSPLQPSDYNSDHTILSSYRNQLVTAHKDNVTAYNEAKDIIAALKSL
jgi:hypothetical protein